jgi:hypothetical protein
MSRTADDHFDEVLKLLKQQRDLLARFWPYSGEQTTKDKELSFRTRELIDRLRVSDSTPNTAS